MVLAHISGKMRKRFIRLTTGDRVKLHMSPTIPTRRASFIASIKLQPLSVGALGRKHGNRAP
jgi:hypothetical protein